ncbi:hypothetical protein AMTRI_Chr03g51010 [Amborella trichopoda]
MQKLTTNNSDLCSGHPTSPYTAKSSSWWNSSGIQVPKGKRCMTLNLEMDSSLSHPGSLKHLETSLPEQDSCSSQSTGQSEEAAGVIGGSGGFQGSSAQPVDDETGRKGLQTFMKAGLPAGPTEYFSPLPQMEYGHSFTHVPCPYMAASYFGGALAPYGSQAMLTSQTLGLQQTRMLLPLDWTEEPVYVNAKQYHAILRRRQSRAKLEAQNKLVKSRKPYLHESRHLHAMKRVRGRGGRFVNTKNNNKSEEANISSGAASLQAGSSASSEVLQPENANIGHGISEVSSSLVAYLPESGNGHDSFGEFFRHSNFRLSVYGSDSKQNSA